LTVAALPLGVFRLTVKVALIVPASSSFTVTSPTAIVGRGSLSVIVPTPWLSASVAFVGPLRLTKKVSLSSSSRSALTVTATCLVVSPAAKSTAPLVAS
jgi:hypothetical protein